MGDIKNKNLVMVSYCPICGRELVWVPFEPINYPGADYVAYCVYCCREFGVSANKDKK